MVDASLKDRALGPPQVHRIAHLVQVSWPKFDARNFVRIANQVGFQQAGILGRVRMLSGALAERLPSHIDQSTEILLQAIKRAPLPATPFGNFVYAPFSDFVALRGCTSTDLFSSLGALREMTMYYSSELALRPFLTAFPRETLKRAREWCSDPREQVRRLASEATRPLLPWAPKVNLPRDPVLHLLALLRDDESEFVLRSVGNHLDDVAKQDPKLAVRVLRKWIGEGWRGSGAKLVIRHATRSLLRAGDPRAYWLLGMRSTPSLTRFEAKLASKRVPIDGLLVIRATGETSTDELLRIDAEFEYPAAAAGKVSKRVLSVKWVRAKTRTPFEIEHGLRMSSTSTRTLRPGRCSITLRVNGAPKEVLPFTLTG